MSLLLKVPADFCLEPNIWSTGLIIIIRVVTLRLAVADDIW